MDDKAARDLLRSAAWLIRQPMCWSRLAIARDMSGLAVPVSWPTAVQWCGRGALLAIEPKPHIAYFVAEELFFRRHGQNIPPVNDLPNMTAARMAQMMREAAEE